MRRSRFFLFASLIVGIVSLFTLPAGVRDAQNLPTDQNNQVVINASHVTEQNGTQALDLDYTLLDVNGQPATSASISKAAITVNNVSYPATLVAASNPLALALVIDISGNTYPARTPLRNAINALLNTATAGTLFSVYTFNQTITQILAPTADANAAHTAINNIFTFGGGACEYDAVNQAVSALRGANPNGRNAVLLFTSDNDSLPGGKACSQINLQGLIARGIQLPVPVPVYAIGLQNGQSLDETPLRTLVNSTHGFYSLGGPDKLGTMFQTAITALNTQMVAKAQICVPQGKQQATLTLNGSSRAYSQTVDFQTATTCVPVTIVPTNTPAPLVLSLSPFSFSAADEKLSFQVLRQGDGTISKYHIQIKYKTSNIQVPGNFGDFIQDANTPIAIPTTGIRTDTLVVTVQAIGSNDQPIGTAASGEVLLDRPTTTPSPVLTATTPPTFTSTPAPPDLSGFQVDPNAQTLTFTIGKPNSAALSQYEIRLRYKTTGIQVTGQYGDFKIDANKPVSIPIQDIQDGDLVVEVRPLDANGQPVGPSATGDVVIQRPTATPPPPIAFAIQSITQDDVNKQLAIKLSLANITSVTGYSVSVIDKSGIEKYNQPYKGLPGSTVTIPYQALTAGDYTATITLNTPDQTVPVQQTQKFTFTPPAKGLLDNPLLVVMLAVIAVVALVIIGWLLSKVLFGGRGRSSRKPARSAAPVRGRSASVPGVANAVGGAGMPVIEHTMIAPIESTLGSANPATLTVIKSALPPAISEFELRSTPFRIGKRGGQPGQTTQLDFDGDPSISRNHAIINREAADRYTITDTSRNGVLVDGKRIVPNQPTPLAVNADVLIDLSADTQLKFRVERAGDPPTMINPLPGSPDVVNIPAPSSPVPQSGPARNAIATAPLAPPAATLPTRQSESTPPIANSEDRVSNSTRVVMPASIKPPPPANVPPAPPDSPIDPAATSVGMPEPSAPDFMTSKQTIPASIEATLTVLEAARLARNTKWQVAQTPYLIGRNNAGNDAELPSNDISREQAALIFNPADMRFGVFDRKSVNGTFLDGNRLEPEVIYWLNPDRTYELRFDRQQATALTFRYTRSALTAGDVAS